ncbi:NADH:flavin oxidoreductase [Clostridium sp. DL1XJH146]
MIKLSLFDKTKINNMELKNRFVRSATWMKMADDKGHLTEKLFNIYEDLAKGGVGLIITGYAYIMEEEKPNEGMLGIYEDSFIEEYRKLTEMVHSYDSKIMLQIVYGGSSTRYKTEERVIWGMSSVENKNTGVIPKEISKEEINELVKSFGNAAERAKLAGFDAVEIHGAHGYLLSQTLSPYYNRRKDEYGGSIENRGRMILEVYDEVRNRVGKEYPVTIKLNCSDFDEDGATFDDCKYISGKLQEKEIDAIEVSGGVWKDKSKEEAIFKDYAAELAQNLNIPIILVALNRSLENMDSILNSTKIQYFSMCRPFIREPNLINRWQSGDKSKAKCISCGKCYSENGVRCIFQ